MIATSVLWYGFQQYWDEDDLVRIPIQEALRLGFHDDDALILSELGLPKWSAPNFMIKLPSNEKRSSRFLEIGKGRNGEQIVYMIDSGDIRARSDSCAENYVSSGLRQLCYILILYARMVDCAISRVGSSAFMYNKIPSELIDDLEKDMISLLGVDHWGDSFWNKEIKRLRCQSLD